MEEINKIDLQQKSLERKKIKEEFKQSPKEVDWFAEENIVKQKTTETTGPRKKGFQQKLPTRKFLISCSGKANEMLTELEKLGFKFSNTEIFKAGVKVYHDKFMEKNKDNK